MDCSSRWDDKKEGTGAKRQSKTPKACKAREKRPSAQKKEKLRGSERFFGEKKEGVEGRTKNGSVVESKRVPKRGPKIEAIRDEHARGGGMQGRSKALKPATPIWSGSRKPRNKVMRSKGGWTREFTRGGATGPKKTTTGNEAEATRNGKRD